MADSVMTGIITNQGRKTFAKSFGKVGTGISTFAFKFRYGEGGFIQTPSGRIPKSPEDGVALLDVEATSLGLYSFTKEFVPTDIQYIDGTSTLQLRCRLVELEANDNGSGDSPRFFELGVFDSNDNLMAYATFSEQTKTGNKILTNYIQIVF